MRSALAPMVRAPWLVPVGRRRVAVAGIHRRIASSAASKDGGGPQAVMERIEEKELHREASESYLAYAMSVIVGRALPDVRDGLKPVQRRILYAMHDMGLYSNKPYRKCARVVGEVLGKFHPHGDAAVYAALVRMAQDFSMRQLLVAGHGNFGSIDNDPAAAMRYTECRLDMLSSDMLLADLASDTVDFLPTFDGVLEEPSVLPARFPNLLINGSAGIAVGVATKIPPHNMSEVLSALKALAHNPSITIDELMDHIPAPDFPTGGEILSTSGIRKAYMTGNGNVIMRGCAHIEEASVQEGKRRMNGAATKPCIVITELPYKVSKEDLVEALVLLVENQTVKGVADVRDESDRKGIRIVVEVKRGNEPQLVLNNLYKHSRLMTQFSCNMVALIDGAPKELNLKELLTHFIEFRRGVIQRRARCHLEQSKNQLHLVVGFLSAINDLDNVIKTIRASRDSAAARKKLISDHELSEAQADGVLSMSLRRLTSMETDKLEREGRDLELMISDLEDLLGKPERVMDELIKEASDLERQHRTKRRTTVIHDASWELSELDIIPNTPSILVYSRRGFLKRVKPENFIVRKRGGKGVYGAKMHTDDSMAEILHVMAHDSILLFSKSGIVYCLQAYQIPESSRTSAGTAIGQIIPSLKNDHVAAIMPLSDVDEAEYLLMLTSNGAIKKTPMSAFRNIRSIGLTAMKVAKDDALLWVSKCTEHHSVLVASKRGMATRFNTNCQEIRPHSRISGGVQAMNLQPGDRIVGMVVLEGDGLAWEEDADADETLEETANHAGSQELSEDVDADDDAAGGKEQAPGDDAEPCLFMITAFGMGKRVRVRDFPIRHRRGRGIIAIKPKEGDRLAGVLLVGPNGQQSEVMVASTQGMFTRTTWKNVRIHGRAAQGVKVMDLQKGDEVQSITAVMESPQSE